ncbi:hypothetical protein BDW59DRAFT_162401 [Aspergillus cavernicola]|uniref:protein-histidine N-methyltransferase n=1 Tax=Aspergillus cavernicola TaxID=176166 RepID=A0ABR4I9X2_9EURO
MTSTFSFGFAGDDIDIDDIDVDDVHEKDTSAAQEGSRESGLPELVAARKHGMDEWLPTLPSQISYNKCIIRPSQGASTESKSNFPLTIARREVFDIRAQLMAEDGAEEENGELIAGLEKGDITPNFYEGGFKTWECSVDLAGLLVAEGVEIGGHVVELGAGTAIPSLALFAQMLARTGTEAQSTSPPTSTSTSTKEMKRTHFTFADYNSAVLRLVTLPNLLLTWNHVTTRRHPTPAFGVQHEDKTDEHHHHQQQQEEEGEEEEFLDITPGLLNSFQRDLAQRGITIDFISGAWSPSFVDLVFSSSIEVASLETLVLASETIYSPASLVAFSETLLALLCRSSVGSRALLAAKKVYFGVGGGVDEFLAVLRRVSDSELRVEERMDVKSEGVGRIVLEIGAGI